MESNQEPSYWVLILEEDGTFRWIPFEEHPKYKALLARFDDLRALAEIGRKRVAQEKLAKEVRALANKGDIPGALCISEHRNAIADALRVATEAYIAAHQPKKDEGDG